MRQAAGNPSGPGRVRRIGDALLLLVGGFTGGALLTVLQVPAGALIGAVIGSAMVNQIAGKLSVRSRRRWPWSRRPPSDSLRERRVLQLPGWARVVGQVLLGVMAGTRLNEQTLHVLAAAAIPVAVAVVVMLAANLLLARYLFRVHGIDPLTAAMAAAPGGISELAVTAQRRGAAMHVVLSIHLFRVLVVVLLVLPLLLLILEPQ